MLSHWPGFTWKFFIIWFHKILKLIFQKQLNVLKIHVLNIDENYLTWQLSCKFSYTLKPVSAIFYQIFIFHQMIALQKLWKMFFISSKKLFSFSRYSNFCIFVFPSCSPVSHCFRDWCEKNLKVYDVINFLNKNVIAHFVLYLETEISCDIETLSIDR